MTTAFAGLMCHAPIVVPEVGGSRTTKCLGTTRAMREVASRVVAAMPDRLVLVSPHSPRSAQGFSAWRGPRHIGDLGDFRAPQVRIDLPDAPEVAQELGLPPIVRHRDRCWLDHGAMVPLAFLWDAGWRGPTAILALPAGSSAESEDLGRRLAELPGRTAVIASGDMSHRLRPGAPSGYHPHARDFDRAFVDALDRDDWDGAVRAQPRELAAEDVVDSTRVAMGAAREPLNAEVLSYEGPWGVGYTEAVLHDPRPPLYALARRAIRDHVLRRRPRPVPPDGPRSQGVFVTLRRDGELRGCIGRIEPRCDALFHELAQVAVSAASEDRRFPPLRRDELSDLDIEVSLLSPTEPVTDRSQLDPAVYGVVMQSGSRRALMLPGVPGLRTVEQQLSATRKKAGIPAQAPVQLERFTVVKERQP